MTFVEGGGLLKEVKVNRNTAIQTYVIKWVFEDRRSLVQAIINTDFTVQWIARYYLAL